MISGGLFGTILLAAIFLPPKRISIFRPNGDSSERDEIRWQNKNSNCGPIALKMILDYYAVPSTLLEIETRVKLNSRGATMLAMKETAERKGLHAEGWRLTLRDLANIHFPVILFVNGDHYIVADSLFGETLFARDPSFGKIEVPLTRLSDHWKGETLIFKKK